MWSLMASSSVFRLFGQAVLLALQLGQRRLKGGAGGDNDAVLDEVLKLADIARPVISDHQVHGFRRDLLDNFIHPLCELNHEVTNQGRNILAAIAEGWQFDREDTQAIKQ